MISSPMIMCSPRWRGSGPRSDGGTRRTQTATGRKTTAGLASRKQLEIGSDVEIAERVAKDLYQQFGDVIFTDGAFYHFAGSHWMPILDHRLRCLVHPYDGAEFATPKGDAAAVKLGKNRVTSVINEMDAMLAEPNFFINALVGINCTSGFIAFAADGTPMLWAHHPDHRCRNVLSGSWQPGNTEEPPPGALLEKLLSGIFFGDFDANQKCQLLAETAGAGASGYATKLRRPMAIILEGSEAENGKSQILDIARGALPKSAVSAIPPAKISDERFVVHLVGRLLNAADEASKAIAGEEFKKAITGEAMRAGMSIAVQSIFGP
jgi:putative DNA primase/helicase